MIRKAKQLHQLFLIVFIMFAVGCASQSNITQIINLPDQKLKITSLAVSKRGDVWRVYGRLNAPDTYDLPSGHILLTVLNRNEKVIQEKSVSYRGINSAAGRHRHNFGTALFSATFEGVPKESKVVARLVLDS